MPTLTVAVFNENTGWALPQRYLDRLAAVSPEVQVQPVASRAELLKVLPATDYLLGFPVSDEQFQRVGGNLKWIQLTSTTLDPVADSPGVVASPVRITTTETIQCVQRSEHAVMLILALTRRLHEAFTAQEDHHWAGHDLSESITDLSGKTIGLIGMGPLGRATAKRLRPFDVEILATLGDQDDQFAGVDHWLPEDRLDELLGRSDIVVLTLGPTAPRGTLFNRSMLTNLNREAMLVNVSHVRVCDDTALTDLLNQHRIAAAALDTFETVPLPEASPLWRMSNVIITPRSANVSPRYWTRAMDVICENLQRLLDGRPLIDEWTR